MSHKKLLIAVLGIAILGMGIPHARAQEGAPSQTGSAQPSANTIDQRALDKLKLMSDTLSQAKSLHFEARSLGPIKSPNGTWISLYGSSRVVKEGSEKLYVESRGDLFPYDFYFNGKMVTAYAPSKNLYAEKAAPGTVDDVIEAAYREEGKTFPYADILLADPFKVLTEGLVSAVYVGQSTLRPLSGTGSAKADHLAFSHQGVEWQIWIDAESHLPRLVCATYLDNAGEPSYTVEFGDWKINEIVSPGTFTFQNTSKATKVEFRNPMQQGRGVSSGVASQQ
jgi:hypothetical protein